jgi:hypothetical protein
MDSSNILSSTSKSSDIFDLIFAKLSNKKEQLDNNHNYISERYNLAFKVLPEVADYTSDASEVEDPNLTKHEEEYILNLLRM